MPFRIKKICNREEKKGENLRENGRKGNNKEEWGKEKRKWEVKGQKNAKLGRIRQKKGTVGVEKRRVERGEKITFFSERGGRYKYFFYNVFRLPTRTPPTPVRASQAR